MISSLYRLENGNFFRDPDTNAFPKDQCCPCVCTPQCVWVTLDWEHSYPPVSETYEVQLDLGFSASCFLSLPPETEVKCGWSDNFCSPYGGYHIGLLQTVDDEFYVCVQSSFFPLGPYTSLPNLTGPYGVYTFAGEAWLTITISARLPALSCGVRDLCVQYVKAGESWNVVRVPASICFLPQSWDSGWTEDWNEYLDFFECDVVADDPCVWDWEWDDAVFHVVQTVVIDGGEPVITEFDLNLTLKFPATTHPDAAAWGGLTVDWSGVWHYQGIANAGGPLGTYFADYGGGNTFNAEITDVTP